MMRRPMAKRMEKKSRMHCSRSSGTLSDTSLDDARPRINITSQPPRVLLGHLELQNEV